MYFINFEVVLSKESKTSKSQNINHSNNFKKGEFNGKCNKYCKYSKQSE